MMSSSKSIFYSDDFEGYSLEHFHLPELYKSDLERVLIPAGLVRDRTRKLAKDIVTDFNAEPILAVCVLKGAYRFYSELLEEMKNFQPGPITIDFVRLKSYIDTDSTGNVQFIGSLQDFLNSIAGKNVLLVEDIIDTGRTMQQVLQLIESSSKQPRALKVVSLLLKRTPKSCGYRPDYIGFEIPDCFVVGCAFDYNEKFRDLNHVCVLNRSAIAKYSMKKQCQES